MNGRAGPGPGPGTHNAPLFSTGEVSLPRLEKENICDWLGVGNIGLLMLVCFNVRITGEFSIFGVTFNVAIWYSLEEAYEGGLDVIFNYGSGRRPQGLSQVGIVCI